jgi:Tfp pilus assembly major pilin PilA
MLNIQSSLKKYKLVFVKKQISKLLMLSKRLNIIFKLKPTITLISFIKRCYNKIRNTFNKLNIMLSAMQAITTKNSIKTFVIYKSYLTRRDLLLHAYGNNEKEH